MKSALSVLLSILVLGCSAAGQDATGIKIANLKDANLDLMNNHDPASQLENFELLDGYQVNLFAADPMLANPIHMHWDSRGRLWVACSWAYPQLKPGEVANDKIIILEDTDDDGVADKSTVFADGLYMPTGLELANGGCYVAQTPDVFFLKDTDGDDVADVKELALTGFGIEDSHHSVSAWRRGPGGWIYFQEGIFLHAQVETQYGVVRNFNGGVYQYNPRTQQLRVFCSGTGGNPWGHVFDRWGQSFMVNNPRIMYLSPATGNSGDQIRINALISTEKQCGGDLATGTHVADDIRGNLLSGRFKSRTVIRYEFIEDGAGYTANVLEPLMTSKHPNFRPVDVKTGPDGAIYVADWYNSIINHAQHDFRDPRRDHEHGRIWRITHKSRPLAKKPQLVPASIAELVDHLKSPEAWTRHQARKELSEKDPDQVFAELERWVDQLDRSLPEYDHHLVEAMWACQNVERTSEKILEMVLGASDGHARSAGARVIRYWHNDLPDPIGMIARAADDPFPRTRMEAVLSAGFVPDAQAYAAALHVIDHPGDPFLDLALPQTKKALDDYWRPALEAGTLRFAKSSHEDFAKQSAGIGFAETLSDFLAETQPSEKDTASVCEQLAAVGTNEDIQLVLATLSKGDTSHSAAATAALLETLKQMAGSHRSRVFVRKARSLKHLLKSDDETIAILAAENLAAWGANKIHGDLVNVLTDSSRPASVRNAAAIALAKLGRTENLETLTSLANDADLQTRYCAVSGLASADVELGVTAAAALFGYDPGDVNPVPALQAILKNRIGAKLLAKSLSKDSIHPVVKERISEFHRSSGLLGESAAKLFDPATGTESLTARLLAENQESLSADVDRYGDPKRGEMIYRRKSLSCTNCHAIGPVGPLIGPNLVAVGAAAKTSYMIESILEPNKAIAEHFENRMFLLEDGSTQTGIITFKSDDEVVVRDAAQGGKEVHLPVDEILAERPMPSAMPAGLADQLASRQEFLDLAKFVSVLGKPGPYANDESPVIRKWRIHPAPSGDGIDETGWPADDAKWITAYSKVDGELPAADLAIADRVLARAYVNVQVAGRLRLDVDRPEGLRVWVDGEELESVDGEIELAKGRRSVTFIVSQAAERDFGLRVELVSVVDSPAKFQPEGGT
tara:strand:+ start:70211 stop:73630 length:3420 start_codon:yes stop_codon:yes gene_type:complete